MPPDRRTFLKLAGSLWLVHGLGRIVFCRASPGTAQWLPLVLGTAIPVCEWIDRDEVVLCGTEATLVIDKSGFRRFA